jgi:hypothetical protein
MFAPRQRFILYSSRTKPFLRNFENKIISTSYSPDLTHPVISSCRYQIKGCDAWLDISRFTNVVTEVAFRKRRK